MLNEIIKILSLVTNRKNYVKESRLCLLNIQYEKNVIIDDCCYDMYSLTIKNTGNYDIENIKFNRFECNKTIQPFFINAGETYFLKILFPKGWIAYHFSVYERITYYVAMSCRKRKYFAQDLCISCGVNKELVTAYFTKRSC